MKLKNKSGQIYTPSLLMRLFVLGMGLFIAGMHTIILRNVVIESISPLLVLLLMLILAVDGWFVWYGLIFTTQTRVTVNEDGIEFQRGGSRIFAAWENVSHFGVKGYGKSQRSGIYLFHKIQPEVEGFAERLFFNRETDFVPIGQAISLPVRWGIFRRDINLKKLAQTNFGRDVSCYADHLLDEFDKKSKASSKRLTIGSHDATYVVGADSQKLRKHG